MNTKPNIWLSWGDIVVYLDHNIHHGVIYQHKSQLSRQYTFINKPQTTLEHMNHLVCSPLRLHGPECAQHRGWVTEGIIWFTNDRSVISAHGRNRYWWLICFFQNIVYTPLTQGVICVQNGPPSYTGQFLLGGHIGGSHLHTVKLEKSLTNNFH